MLRLVHACVEALQPSLTCAGLVLRPLLPASLAACFINTLAATGLMLV